MRRVRVHSGGELSPPEGGAGLRKRTPLALGPPPPRPLLLRRGAPAPRVPPLEAAQIVAAGFRLECEMLTTREVSLTIFDIDKEEDVAIRVVPNGPQVPPAVDDLILGYELQE